jgi:hypothetical protein
MHKTRRKPASRVSRLLSQTTDAAALAAIDTSGYVLPAVKVPGRRGRKPKEFTPENDEVAALNAVERAELKAVDKAKAKDRKAKEKALLKDAFSSDTEASEEELEIRRQKLKALIKSGKERGFLTYARSTTTCPKTSSIRKRSKASSAPSTTWALPSTSTRPMPNPAAVRQRRHRHQRRRSRSRRRSGAVDRRLRLRPHHRPGPHVHARNGLGRAADPRRRDRNRQTHRRRPARHDPGDLGLPGDDRRNHRRRPPHRADEIKIDEIVDGLVDDEATEHLADRGRAGRDR